jgi:CRP/FNR family transcriptional activator FtrB
MRGEESNLPRGERSAEPLRGTPLEALAASGRVLELPRGALLFEQGRPAELLHVLLHGAVALSADEGGRHGTIVELVRPLDCVGLEAVLAAAPHAVTARTVEPSRLLLVAAEEVRRRLLVEPALAGAMIECLAARNRLLVGQIKDLKLRSGPQRLGCWLLRLVDEQGHGTWARLSIPKGMLAQLLGMTAETLSRALGTLRDQGIDVRGNHVVVVDRRRFEALCRREPPDEG